MGNLPEKVLLSLVIICLVHIALFIVSQVKK